MPNFKRSVQLFNSNDSIVQNDGTKHGSTWLCLIHLEHFFLLQVFVRYYYSPSVHQMPFRDTVCGQRSSSHAAVAKDQCDYQRSFLGATVYAGTYANGFMIPAMSRENRDTIKVTVRVIVNRMVQTNGPTSNQANK